MKVILRSDRKGLGKRGDIVEVAEGHARNFLFPKGHALPASEGAVAQAQAMRRARDLRDAADRDSAQSVATKLVATPITIKVKAGAEGRLFGSVTSSDVAEAIESQTKISIDRRKLSVDHIKTTGQHVITAKLHADVEFPITLDIVAK